MFIYSSSSNSRSCSAQEQQEQRREERTDGAAAVLPLSSIFCGGFRDAFDNSFHGDELQHQQEKRKQQQQQEEEEEEGLVRKDRIQHERLLLLQEPQPEQHCEDESRDEESSEKQHQQEQEMNCTFESFLVLQDRRTRCEEEQDENSKHEETGGEGIDILLLDDNFYHDEQRHPPNVLLLLPDRKEDKLILAAPASSTATSMNDDNRKEDENGKVSLNNAPAKEQEVKIRHQSTTNSSSSVIDVNTIDTRNDDLEKDYIENNPTTTTETNTISTMEHYCDLTSMECRKQDLLRTFMMNVSSHGRYSVEVANTLQSLGSLHENCAELDDALNCYQESLDIYSCNLGDYSSEVLNVQLCLGRVHGRLGNDNEALKMYSRVLDVMTRATHQEEYYYRNAHCAKVRVDISKILHSKGFHNEAIKELKQALECFRQCYGSQHESVAKTMHFMTIVWNASAKKEHENTTRSCTIPPSSRQDDLRVKNKSKATKSAVEMARTLEMKAGAHEQQGNFMAALRTMKKSYEILLHSDSQQEPDSHVNMEKCLEKISILYYKVGKIEKSIKARKSITSIRKQVYGECSVELASSYLALGKTYVEASQHEKAWKALNRAMTCYCSKATDEAAMNKDCIHDIMDGLHSIGTLYYETSKFKHALDVLEKEKQMRQELLVCCSNKTSISSTSTNDERSDEDRGILGIANTLLLLGKTQCALQMFTEAKKTLMDALDHYDKSSEGRKNNFAEALFYCGKASEGLYGKSHAITFFKQSYQICMANAGRGDEECVLMKKAHCKLLSMNFVDDASPAALKADFACDVRMDHHKSSAAATSTGKSFPSKSFTFFRNFSHRVHIRYHHLLRITTRVCCSLYRRCMNNFFPPFFDLRACVHELLSVFSSFCVNK
jgi:tetratricopeptide (TPR) repeat protein